MSYCIRAFGRDNAGKSKKLEGNTTLMFLRDCAASVEVKVLDTLPIDYQNATVTLRASMLNAVLNVLDEVFGENVLPEIGTTLSRAADKRAIKAAIESGIDVPGAKLITDKTTLGRK